MFGSMGCTVLANFFNDRIFNHLSLRRVLRRLSRAHSLKVAASIAETLLALNKRLVAMLLAPVAQI